MRRARQVIPILGAVLLIVLAAQTAWAGAYEDGIGLFNNGQYQAAAERFRAAVEQNPNNVDAMKKLGDCYFNIYSSEKPEFARLAIEAYTKALQADPNDGVTRLHLAQMYSWTEDSENALKELKTLLQREPQNTTAMLEMAEIYSWKPETYNQSLEQCYQVLKVDPKNKRAQLIAARVLSWKGEHTKALAYYEALLNENPNDAKVRAEYANALSAAGRFDDAVQQFNYLVSNRGTRDQNLLGLAEALYRAKRYTEALAVIDAYLQREPNNGYAYRLKGLIYSEQRRLNEAVAAFQKAIEINPQDVDAKLFLAHAYAMNEGTFPEAVNAYRQVLEAQPDNIEVRAELARIYSEANNHGEAIQQYRALLQQHPKEVKIRADLVRALVKAEKYPEAIQECEELVKTEPDNVDHQLLMADVLVRAKRYEEAIDLYEEIVDKNPKEMRGMVGLGWAHHRFSRAQADRLEKLQQQIQKQLIGLIDRVRWLFVRLSEMYHYNRALSVLTDAAEKFPDSTEPQMRLAEVYAEQGAYKESLESYEQVLKRDPRNVDAYLGMSWVYNKLDDKQKSIDAIRRAAQIDPTNVEVLGGLGDAYAYQQDNVQAIEALEKAVMVKFADLDLHRRLANLYAQNRKYYDKALLECDYILKQDTKDDNTRLLKARVLSWSEKYDEALPIYADVLSRRPNDQDLYIEMMEVKIYSSSSDEVVAELHKKLEKETDAQKILATRLALAHAYEVQENWELAEKEYRTVLQSDPKNGRAHLGLATIYRQREQFDRAVIEYREVLSSNPDSAEAYYGLGVIDRRNARYERAIAMQKKVLELDPSNLNAFAELSYDHYLLSRSYIATTGQYQRAWWLLGNNWGDIYGVWGEYPANIEQMRAVLLEDPGNCDLRYLLAQELQNHNRNKEAVREYRTLLRYCPNHLGARTALADIFSYSPATYAWAIQETLEIVKREPDNYDAHLRLARLYSWSLQYNASIGQYAWCIQRRPDEIETRMELADVLTYAKRYQEAINQYEIILAQDPTRDDVRLELAKTFSYNERVEDAIREYETILKRNPNNYEASFALANLYSWDRRYYHRAIDLYRKLFLKYPQNTEARMDYGRLLYERGEFGQAEKAYRDAIVLEPNNVDAHLMLGRIYIGQNKRDEAIGEFKKVLELKSDSVDANYYLAQIYAGDKETWPQAIQYCQAVLQVEPNNEEVRVLLARIYSFQENYAAAAQQYKVLYEAHPDDEEIATAYALNLNYAEQYSDAVEIFKQLSAKKPNDMRVRLEMGLAYYELGLYQDAIVNLEFVVEHDSWNVRARRGLARSYKASNQVDAAIAAYKRILVINPNDQEAAEFLKAYNITYTQTSLLDEYFTWPGKTELAQAGGGSGVPQLSPEDEAEQRYRLSLAEELLANARYQRARHVYEELVEKNPNNAYYHLALANAYAVSGMWASAKREYRATLNLDPGNEDAVRGMAHMRYEMAPRIDVFAGVNDGRRFDDRVTVFEFGSRFTYRFGDGGEVFGEVAFGRHAEDGFDEIYRISPSVGVKVGIVEDLFFSGQYRLNMYDRVAETHNWSGALSYNVLDVVGLEAYYFREDIRQTLLAMEQRLGEHDFGGAITITPINRLDFRGEYRYGMIDETDVSQANRSQFVLGGVNYTFFNDPYFTVGYTYTYLTFAEQDAIQANIYWAPREYQQHALPLALSGNPTPDVYYEVGLVPSYNVVDPGDDTFGLFTYANASWQAALKHRLGIEASYGTGLQGAEYWEYSVMLKYTFIFGQHSGIWR